MNEEREQAYRKLVSTLLTYPNQAAKILDANPKLLDAGLMQIMKQVATRMAANGSTEAADFLQNLVAQLKDELTAVAEMIKPELENRSQIKESLKPSQFELLCSGTILLLSGFLIVLTSQSGRNWLSNFPKVLASEFEQGLSSEMPQEGSISEEAASSLKPVNSP